MASNAARPVWVKQAEEAKLKQEQEKSAVAWEAFNSTFKDVNVGPAEAQAEKSGEAPDSDDSEEDEAQISANKPIGPVDPGKCTAAGTGVTGGAAGAAASFVIITKDSYGRRIPEGGAQIKVKMTAAAGASVGDDEQEAIVKDHGDGTYTVTYAVAKRGNYVVSVDCNGMPILNSPFPVFFSGGTVPVSLTTPASLLPAPFTNGVTQNPYLGGLSSMYASGVPNMQVPLAPSAAAMAAAQAIMAARAYEAAQAREAASAPATKETKEDEEKQKELLTRTLQVSNLSSMLNVEQLKTLFSFCGIVTDCKIDDSKQLAYVEYAKTEEAKAALSLNNMGVGGRPLNVEMAKSLPSKKSANASNGLPVMMQQAVALQQFQFQQALLMQQAVASQQAALQAATAKTASETAAARAAEITRSLNITVTEPEVKEVLAKSTTTRSKHSRSPSPIRYRPRQRSPSRSPIRYRRGRQTSSHSRDLHRHGADERGRAWFYRSAEDYYRFRTSHFRDRERDYEHRSSHRRSPARSRRKVSSRSPKSKGGNRSRSPRSRTENKNHSRSRSPRQRVEEKRRSRSRSPRRKTKEKSGSRSRSPRQRAEVKDHNQGYSPRQRMEDKKRSRSHSPDHGMEDHGGSHSPQEKAVEASEKGRSSHTKSFAKEVHDKQDREQIEKTSSRRGEATSPMPAKEVKTHDEHPTIVASLEQSSHRLEKLLAVNCVEVEKPDQRFTELIPAKAVLDTKANQHNVPFDETLELAKVSEADERGRVDVKERRHHEKKHRRDDDEMKEKKKRRHKHRSRRSSSDSADAKKNDRDDGSSHRKSSKRRNRHSRSASVSNSGGN